MYAMPVSLQMQKRLARHRVSDAVLDEEFWMSESQVGSTTVLDQQQQQHNNC